MEKAKVRQVCRRCGDERVEGVTYTEACLMAPDGTSGHEWKVLK
jgi:hypothetical protein